MTRIYTNVASLTAQKALNTNLAGLETSLQRLSTGLRINSGKDDPSGLIASEMLRSEMAGVQQAISNTQQANNMIAVADSALNEVSNLLISIRGLVTEAANTAVMSEEMIAANQLQVDATLNAIDRISSSTTFMGQQLLDGSLNFVLEGVDRSTLQNMQVYEAQFGTSDHINVAVNVQTMAEKAELFYGHAATLDDIILTWKGNLGADVKSFAAGTSISEIAGFVNATSDATGVRAILNTDDTYGRMVISSVGPGNDIVVTSNTAGKDGGFIEIKFTKGSDRGIYVDYQESLGTGSPAVINVMLQTEAWKGAEANNVITANPAGVDQNSALNFLANIEGDKYNDTSINIVDGNLTDAFFNDAANNPTGVAGGVHAEYWDEAKSATAVVGGINGMDEFANSTGYLALESTLTGSKYNNVTIQFAADNSGAVRGAAQAAARFDEQNKTLTVYVNTNAGTEATFADIVAAINADKTFKASFVGDATDQIAVADCFGNATAVTGNTNNSGGDAGTLYIYATTQQSPNSLLKTEIGGFENTGGSLDFSAKFNGPPYDQTKINFVADSTKAAGSAFVEFDAATQAITVYVMEDFSTTFTQVEAAFNASNAAPYFTLTNNIMNPGNTLSPKDLGYATIADSNSTDHYVKISPVQDKPPYNQATINYVKGGPPGDASWDPAANAAKAVYDKSSNVLTIYSNPGVTDFDALSAAINGDPAISSLFKMEQLSTAVGTEVIGTTALDVSLQMNLSNVPSGAVRTYNTAQDIVNAFDTNLLTSVGSERAADFFSVKKSIDNDGTGVLFSQVFKNVFKDGVTGGDVISTAQQVVAALNHSEYWGTVMTPEQLAQWIADADKPVDPCDPTVVQDPILWAMVAPGDHGLSAVTAFEEVAYYGDPYQQNGLQFLGPEGSKPIRFVAAPNNDTLSVDFTTYPDVVDYSQAILNGVNPYAQVVITANQKGEQNDDVLIKVVRAFEDPTADPPFIRDSGWVTYDEGESFAEAVATFNDRFNGTSIFNTAFTVTANDRGNEYNNVGVLMRQNAEQEERVLVTFDTVRNALMVSLKSSEVDPLTAGTDGAITASEIIAAVNAYQGTGTGNGSGSTFTAALSYAVEGNYDNDGSGTFENIGLSTQYMEVANTGSTGGHTGGTVTVYLIGETDPVTGAYVDPTANQVVDLINKDDIVGNKFTARPYVTGAHGGTGAINFLTDTNLVTDGGVSQEGVMTVHLRTDANGKVLTTAAELVAFWDNLSYEQTGGVSVSLVREPGAEWDICNDDGGQGIVPASPYNEECEVVTYDDVHFGAWGDDIEEPIYEVPGYSSGDMVAVNGVDAAYSLVARRTGTDYDGYTLVYSNSPSKYTGKFDDNVYSTTADPVYNGIGMEVDEKNKKITIYINQGVTTANDVKQLIESDSQTRLLFEVQLHGDGTGLVDVRDDTLYTRGGTQSTAKLNGAKLLGGRDGSPTGITFVSTGYGSNQFVDVQSSTGAFQVTDKDGTVKDRAVGVDAEVVVNGVKAVTSGLGVSLNTSTLALAFTLDESTMAGYSSNFVITGGGATFQIGPRVVSNQQITIGIPSINSAELGGVTGRLFELRDGQSASLTNDPTRAYQIIEEAIVQVTGLRGRLGILQAATFEPNISVLQDTYEALATAESEIRDTDFAAETSNLTRNQVLVQSSINALGIANQMPNYILGLLG